MTRQLVDVLAGPWAHEAGPLADRLVAVLLAEPAEHTITCVPCNGKGWAWDQSEQVPCPDCTNGRQTIIIRAERKS